MLYANTAYVPLFYETILPNNMASIWPNVGDSFSAHFIDFSVVPNTVNYWLLNYPLILAPMMQYFCITPEIKAPDWKQRQ